MLLSGISLFVIVLIYYFYSHKPINFPNFEMNFISLHQACMIILDVSSPKWTYIEIITLYCLYFN